MSNSAIISEYEKWLSSDKVSSDMKRELLAIKDNEEELPLLRSPQLRYGGTSRHHGGRNQ